VIAITLKSKHYAFPALVKPGAGKTLLLFANYLLIFFKKILSS
jgi:hypothetical protein